ncbi:hypothetical protein [Bradyrhizobium sp. McL0616]|uniref:hypothetical protein n=1 Tax=Bradyrhizobium sp. McL0616 TaxID=3415674 RepID=UPI003CEBD59F
MSYGDAGGLLELEGEIAKQKQRVEDQEVLISVLEHDGHDVSEQEAALRVERASLALKIVQQIKLMASNSSNVLA